MFSPNMAPTGRQSVVLTHFSQRYPKIPVLAESAAARATGFAFDYMRLPFSAMPALPALAPALQLLFADKDKDDTGSDEPEAT